MDDFPFLWEPPDSPDGSPVLRFWDESVVDLSPLQPVTNDPPPPPSVDHPPMSNAALQEILDWDPFADEVLGNEEGNRVEGQEFDATNLKENGGSLAANESVGWPANYGENHHVGSGCQTVVADDHHFQQNDDDQFPFPELPPYCIACEPLRQTIHYSAMATRRMEIHRGVDSLYHATICTIYSEAGGVPVAYNDVVVLQQFEMVATFMVDYFRRQREEGHDLVYDSNDIDGDGHFGSLPFTSIAPSQPPPKGSNSILNLQPSNSSRTPNDLQPINSSRTPNDLQGRSLPFPKSRLVIQRERTAKMDLDDLKRYMNLPITEAAKRLGVCPTVVKKVCRRNGLRRWPNRKIRVINRQIALVEQSIGNADNLNKKFDMLREIERLNKEKKLACLGNDNIDDESEEDDDDNGFN